MAQPILTEIIKTLDEHLPVIHQAALAPSPTAFENVRREIGARGEALVEVWRLLWPFIEPDERRRDVVINRISRREPWSAEEFPRMVGDILFSDLEVVRRVSRLVADPREATEAFPPRGIAGFRDGASREQSPVDVATALASQVQLAAVKEGGADEPWRPGLLVDGRFELVRKVGRGGFGETWLAEDSAHEARRQCVVKKFTFEHHDESLRADVRARFTKEALVLERLGQGHEQIPSVYAVEAADAGGFFVQEYVEGKNLVELVLDRGPLSEAEILAFLDSLLGVLAFVHENKIIHRDIKPANIIVRAADAVPMLIDFGAVKEVATAVLDGVGHASTTIAIGTQGYMPFEQGLGRPRLATDIFALGFTALYLLTGKVPQQLTSRVTDEVQWSDIGDAASPELRALLTRAVAPMPDARFPTASVMRDEVRKLIRLRSTRERVATGERDLNAWPDLDDVVQGKRQDLLRSRTFAQVILQSGVEMLAENFSLRARVLPDSSVEAALAFDDTGVGGRALIFSQDEDEGEHPSFAGIARRMAASLGRGGASRAVVVFLLPEGSQLLAKASAQLAENLSIRGVDLTVVVGSYDRTGSVVQVNASDYSPLHEA